MNPKLNRYVVLAKDVEDSPLLIKSLLICSVSIQEAQKRKDLDSLDKGHPSKQAKTSSSDKKTAPGQMKTPSRTPHPMKRNPLVGSTTTKPAENCQQSENQNHSR